MSVRNRTTSRVSRDARTASPFFTACRCSSLSSIIGYLLSRIVTGRGGGNKVDSRKERSLAGQAPVLRKKQGVSRHDSCYTGRRLSINASVRQPSHANDEDVRRRG